MKDNMNTAPKIENFVTSLRVAIVALGCSTEKLRNVINAELGNMRKVKDGTPASGDMKVKRPKDETKEWTAANSVKLGTAKYEARATMAHIIKEFNDALAKAEKSCPSFTASIDKDSAMGKWMIQYGIVPANAEQQPQPEQPQQA